MTAVPTFSADRTIAVRPSRPLRSLLCCLGLLVILLAFGSDLAAWPLAAVSALAVVVAAVAVAAVIPATPARIWSASAVYLCTISVFHLGLIALVAIHRPLPEFTAATTDWLTRASMSWTVVVVVIGVVTAATGMLAVFVARARAERHAIAGQVAEARVPDQRLAQRMAGVGLVVLATALLWWLYLVLSSGGPRLLVASYEDFRTAAPTVAISYAYFGLGLGLVLLAAGAPGPTRRIGFGLFALFAVVALPLGLRGEVMFPALAALAVVAKRRRPISARWALVIAVAVLALIGALREVREVGVAQVRGSAIAASPVDGLAELGYSIRPVSEVVTWHDTFGEPLTLGASYVAPVDRLVFGRLLGRPEARAAYDERLFNVVIAERVGPIGGSPVAESYRNGGIVGVVIVMFVTGLLLGTVDTWPPTVARRALTGVVLLPLLIEVRNDFTPVPVQVLVGLAAVAVIVRWPARKATGPPTMLWPGPASPDSAGRG